MYTRLEVFFIYLLLSRKMKLTCVGISAPMVGPVVVGDTGERTEGGLGAVDSGVQIKQETEGCLPLLAGESERSTLRVWSSS